MTRKMTDWSVTRSGAGLRVKGTMHQAETITGDFTLTGVAAVSVSEGEIRAELADGERVLLVVRPVMRMAAEGAE